MIRIVSIALALLAAGCADTMHSRYSQAYVKFEAENNQKLAGLFPATVLAVDGKRINAGETPPFPPGRHTVDVEMRLQHDAYSPERKSIEVEAKACTRYYIATKQDGGRFFPVASHDEPIKECNAGAM